MQILLFSASKGDNSKNTQSRVNKSDNLFAYRKGVIESGKGPQKEDVRYTMLLQTIT